ncbi:hypothetical protein BH11BAC5_BH11BAC5_14360 [soil metagenome]|jgi:hypothetical protein
MNLQAWVSEKEVLLIYDNNQAFSNIKVEAFRAFILKNE